MIESTRWFQKSKRMLRLFSKLLLNFKVLFYEQKFIWPKNKADIKIHVDLTNCHYLSLKDAHSKAKNCASVDFTCADVNCLFCLRLNNDDWKFFNLWKNLLLEIP